MATGDWAPGSQATNRRAEIVIDDTGRVVHCGLGYHIAGPSGRVLAANGGHTWGGPDAQPPEPYRSQLQALMDVLMAEADAAEGLTSASS
jgi:hypothetical protein